MSLKSIEETKNEIISKFYIYIVQLYVFCLSGEIFREISFQYFFSLFIITGSTSFNIGLRV